MVDDINFKVDKVKTGVNVTLYVTLPAEIPVQELTETRYILRKEALEGVIPTLLHIFVNFFRIVKFVTTFCGNSLALI